MVVVHGGQPVTQVAVGRAGGRRASSARQPVQGDYRRVHRGPDRSRPALLRHAAVAGAGPCTIAAHRRPADPRLAAATISQLLAHRAGFGQGGRGERAARAPTCAATRRSAPPSTRSCEVDAARRGSPPARHAHTPIRTAAYLILGAVIEETSGRDYEGYLPRTRCCCRWRASRRVARSERGASCSKLWRLAHAAGRLRPLLPGLRARQSCHRLSVARLDDVARRASRWAAACITGSAPSCAPTPVGGGKFWHWGAWTLRAARRPGRTDRRLALDLRRALGRTADAQPRWRTPRRALRQSRRTEPAFDRAIAAAARRPVKDRP